MLTEQDRADLQSLRAEWADEQEDEMVLLCDRALAGDRDALGWVVLTACQENR